MALLKFLKGNYSSLSSADIVEGQVLICGDTGEMFVDVAAGQRVKIGDYVTVASLEALKAIDAASVPASRLYYVEGANILARSNGTSWDQINKDTGATSIEVVGEGNAVTAASYDAETRKLTLTKGEIFATKSELDTLDAFVGDIPEGYTEETIVAYINKKAEETLNAASGGSSESAASVLGALNTYKASNDARVEAVEKEVDDLQAAIAEGGSVATAIATAQAAADQAQQDVDALEETHATDKKALEDAIALKANAADVYTQGEIDDKLEELANADLAINDKIGEVAQDKTVVEMIADAQTAATYNDTEVRGLINTNAQAIEQEKTDRAGAISGLKTELEGKINSKVEQSAYDEKVGALDDEDERLAGLIGGNTEAINGVSAKVETLVGSDTGKSVRTIANEELAAQLIPASAKESLDTLQEIAAWIQDHPDDASAMNDAIAALEAKVDTGDKTVSAYVTDAIDALKIGDYAKATELAAAVERIVALEAASATHATKDEVKAVSDSLDQYKQAHNADYDNEAVDAKVKAVQDQIDALGSTYATDDELADAIAAEAERADGAYAAKTYEATVDGHVGNDDIHVTTEDKAKWNGAQAAAEATAAANLASARTEITAEIATAKGEAISDAEGKVSAAKTELQGNIDTVSGALDTYKTANDAAVGLKANAADVYTRTEVDNMLTWGTF